MMQKTKRLNLILVLATFLGSSFFATHDVAARNTSCNTQAKYKQSTAPNKLEKVSFLFPHCIASKLKKGVLFASVQPNSVTNKLETNPFLLPRGGEGGRRPDEGANVSSVLPFHTAFPPHTQPLSPKRERGVSSANQNDEPKTGSNAEPTNSANKSQEDPKTNQTEKRSTTIGYPALLRSITIDGTELEVKPIESREQAFILRIVDSFVHGDGFRYDFEYYAFETGRYNLSDYLQPTDGTTRDDLPNLTVEVTAIKPADEAVVPNALPKRNLGFRRFYLSAILIGSVLWVLGLLAILFWGRGKTKRNVHAKQQRTVADRLRPLVDKAARGELTSREQAELERVLDSFWRKKLRIEHLPPKQFREKLRTNPEASKMLNQLDAWLHRPDKQSTTDVTSLLEPYQQLSEKDI